MGIDGILLRFLIAFVASFSFGLVRQLLGKPIGFGSFIFLALGSCALALTAIHFAPDNPLPLLGAIVSGIGFLGAGALFRTGDRVVGFTSAATIWLFAVFGLTVGVGERSHRRTCLRLHLDRHLYRSLAGDPLGRRAPAYTGSGSHVGNHRSGSAGIGSPGPVRGPGESD